MSESPINEGKNGSAGKKRPYPEENILTPYYNEIGKHPLLTREEESRLWKMVFKVSEPRNALLAELAKLQKRGMLLLQPKKNRMPEDKEAKSETLQEIEAEIMSLQEEIRKLENNPDWRSATDQLIVANLRLVISFAKKYHGLTMADRIQSGNEGLIRAVQNFDYTREFHFATYAGWWIRHCIMRDIHNNVRNVRIPVNLYNHISLVQKCERYLFQKFQRQPTFQEIQTELHKGKQALMTDKNVSATIKRPNNIAQLRNMVNRELSLNLAVKKSNSQVEHLDLLTYGKEGAFAGHEDKIVEEDRRAFAEKMLSCLSLRERMIIERYICADEGEVLREIGESIGITSERVRQIKVRALQKMRTCCGSDRYAETSFEDLV